MNGFIAFCIISIAHLFLTIICFTKSSPEFSLIYLLHRPSIWKTEVFNHVVNSFTEKKIK